MNMIEAYENQLDECSVCGRKTICDMHHPDKRNHPDWTVMLCPSCHRECHGTAGVYYQNAAVRSALVWEQNQLEQGSFVHPRQFIQKLQELNYVPAYDFQIAMGYSSEIEWANDMESGKITIEDCLALENDEIYVD